MSHFLIFKATNDVIISVNGLVIQSPFTIKNNDVITIKAKSNVTLKINGTDYSAAQTISLSETNITVTYSTTGAEVDNYYLLNINYSDEIVTRKKGFLKDKDEEILLPYAFGLKNLDGSDKNIGGFAVDLSGNAFDEDNSFVITPQQLAILQANVENYINIGGYIYRSVVDYKQTQSLVYGLTFPNPDNTRELIFWILEINENNLTGQMSHTVINLDTLESQYVTITGPSSAENGNLTQDQLNTLLASKENKIIFDNEIYYCEDVQHDSGFAVYTHTGRDSTGNTYIKCIGITISTLGWVKTTLKVASTDYVDNQLEGVEPYHLTLNGSSGTITQEQYDALAADENSYVINSNITYHRYIKTTSLLRYSNIIGAYSWQVVINNTLTWEVSATSLEHTDQKTQTLSASSTDAQYPSAKAVVDYVTAQITTTLNTAV